ncbi:MAG: phage portal protein [Spirochaetales bacterium]|nr:phage portal protein [Spirochaetales bacterium]
MGLLQKLFPGKTAAVKQAASYFETLNYVPVFKNWKGCLYEQQQVRAAIDALARHSSKLAFTVQGSARPALQNKLKHGPNEYQTWSQFLYQARTILEVDTTLFIVPVKDKYGEVTGVYPINPLDAKIEEYRGKLYIRYKFQHMQVAEMELEDCAILTRFQYDREFFGGGNEALRETLDLLHMQNQGITEGIKNSASFRFMAKHKRFVDPDDLEKEQNRFTKKHLTGKSGFLLWPSDYEDVKQIDSKPFVVDADQQKLINSNISNYFGVNEAIMQNQATGDAWSAFYEGAIEPFAIQLSETLTRMLFTYREQSNGAGVMFTSNRMQYMSNADKLNVSAQMADRGIMSRDEIREIWNLPPIEDGSGSTYIIRGEYYDASQKMEEDNGN